MRSSVFILAVVLAGCGKSFQEADAIYKDEVAKLEAIEKRWADERELAKIKDAVARIDAQKKERQRLQAEWEAKEHEDSLFRPNFSLDAELNVAKRWDENKKALREKQEAIDERFKALIAEQEGKVNSAYKAKEAAK